MRYVSNRLKILGIITVSLAQTACSLSSRSTHHVVISMPEGGFKASVGRVQMRARTTSSTSGGSSFSMPTSIADFNCIAVMITGDGIVADPGLTDSSCAANPDPEVLPRGLGKMIGLVPASGGSIDIEVPGGASRLLQLVGVQTLDGTCPDLTAMLSAAPDSTSSGGGGGGNLGEPFELGRVEADIFADQSIMIKASFDPLTAKPLFACSGGGGGGGGSGPISFFNLDLFPHGATANQMVRVFGNVTGGFHQIQLYSDAGCTSQLGTGQWNSNGDIFSVQGNTGFADMSIYVQASNSSGMSECTPVPGSYVYDSTKPQISIFNPYSGSQITAGMNYISVSGSCTPYGGSGNSIALTSGATSVSTGCTCYAGTNQFSCANVNVGILPDGPIVLTGTITDSTTSDTSDDVIFLMKDSLAPSLSLTAPAPTGSAYPLTQAAASSFNMYGTCGENGYNVDIGVQDGSGGVTLLGSFPCSTGTWNTSPNLDLSSFPDGDLELEISHFGVNGSGHRTRQYFRVTKLAPPVVTSISPPSGSIAGGTTIMVSGSGFVAAGSITIGGSYCGSYTFISSTQVSCTTSPQGAGAYGVVVTGAMTQQSNGTVTYTFL